VPKEGEGNKHQGEGNEISTKGRGSKQQEVYSMKNQVGEPPAGRKLQPTQSPR